DLGLAWITNTTGLAISRLPNGCLFAIEHHDPAGTIMINQALGAPLFGGIGRVLLRVSRPGKDERTVEVVGPSARVRIGTGQDRFVWVSETEGFLCRVTLWIAPDANVWLWWVEVECGAESEDGGAQACLIQDLGLGARSFVTNNEAYASQYIDHHIVHAEGLGPVIMSRQALPQDGRYPWAGHVCLDGAAAFATDAAQIFGPGFRDQAETQVSLPSERLQHECACVGLSGPVRRLARGESVVWTFAGIFVPDHPAASSDADLECVETTAHEARFQAKAVHLAPAARSLLQDAAPLAADDLDTAELDRLWPDRRLEERDSAGRPLSFFVPDGALNRHIVLRAKERMVTRRHGALLRSGASLLPDENALCATVWAHGVFAAQLTIGNTAFHKLISLSR
ncbi:MAG TPA: hypothetical protein VMD08_18135, partial [Candidatus Baltobacteraceae bacterium]|nr:hypothetical protein [Candidatus Baltobacteraceae bacterium]